MISSGDGSVLSSIGDSRTETRIADACGDVERLTGCLAQALNPKP